MKIETKHLTRYLSTAVLAVCFFSSVVEEDVSILTLGRQQGVVPGRQRVPHYHSTSGQYAWEHSDVSY